MHIPTPLSVKRQQDLKSQTYIDKQIESLEQKLNIQQEDSTSPETTETTEPRRPKAFPSHVNRPLERDERLLALKRELEKEIDDE